MTRAEWLASLKTGDVVAVRAGLKDGPKALTMRTTRCTRTKDGRLTLEGYGHYDFRHGWARTARFGHRHIAPLPEVE